MAKRRLKVRAARSAPFKKIRRTHRAAKSGLVYDILAGISYGASRDFVSDKVAPITAKVPGGAYADNLVMGALAWALAKGKIPLLNQIPMSRKVGHAGLVIEAALLGVDIRNQIQARTTTGNAVTNSETAFR